MQGEVTIDICATVEDGARIARPNQKAVRVACSNSTRVLKKGEVLRCLDIHAGEGPTFGCETPSAARKGKKGSDKSK